MKRFAALALALLLALGLYGCLPKSSTVTKIESVPVDDTSLYGHSLELAGLLEEMLQSPAYFTLMSDADNLHEVITPLMRAGLSEPAGAYLVSLPPDALPQLMAAAEVDLDQFSGGLQAFLQRRMLNAVPSILNAQAGAETLAAASILTASKAWAGETLEQGCYVVLHYPHACPVMVSFCGGEGLVEGAATMLIGATLEEDALQGLSGLFDSLGIEGIEVRKLETGHD